MHAIVGPCCRLRLCKPDQRQAFAQQARSCTSVTNGLSSTADMVDWIVSANGQVNSVGVGTRGHEGLGLVATQVSF